MWSAPWRLGRMARSTPGAASPRPAGSKSSRHRPLGRSDFVVAPPGQRDEQCGPTPWRLGRMARSTPAATSPQRRGRANGIARWDAATSSWHPLGSGMNSSVYALTYGPDGSLYAGGDFTTAGGVAANYIARWDAATSSWHSLGSGMNSSVRALAVGPDGSLYAGGGFTTAGGVAANAIARWDAATSSWHPLGSGMGGYYSLRSAP